MPHGYDESHLCLSEFSRSKHKTDSTHFSLRSHLNATCLLPIGCRAGVRYFNKEHQMRVRFYMQRVQLGTLVSVDCCLPTSVHMTHTVERRKKKFNSQIYRAYWQFLWRRAPIQTHREACDNHTLHARRRDWTQTVQFVSPTRTVVLCASQNTHKSYKKLFPMVFARSYWSFGSQFFFPRAVHTNVDIFFSRAFVRRCCRLSDWRQTKLCEWAQFSLFLISFFSSSSNRVSSFLQFFPVLLSSPQFVASLELFNSLLLLIAATAAR